MKAQNLLQEVYSKLNVPEKRMFRDELISTGLISYPHFYNVLNGKNELDKPVTEKIIEIVYHHFKNIDINISLVPLKKKKEALIKRFEELVASEHRASFIYMTLTIEFNLSNSTELYNFLEEHPKFKELIALEINN